MKQVGWQVSDASRHHCYRPSNLVSKAHCAIIAKFVLPLLDKVVNSVAGPALCQTVSQTSVLFCLSFFDLLLEAPLIPAGAELLLCHTLQEAKQHFAHWLSTSKQLLVYSDRLGCDEMGFSSKTDQCSVAPFAPVALHVATQTCCLPELA